MPYIYGQLLNAQIENSTGSPASGGTPSGRMYLDVTSTSNSVPYLHDGTAYRQIVLLNGVGGATGGSATPATGYGTYTPTLTNTTNIGASTASVCNWKRLGNMVIVSGTVAVTQTGTGSVLKMSLPTTTANFTAVSQAGGSGVIVTGTTLGAVAINAISGAQLVQFYFPAEASSSSAVYAFSFMYQVQ